MRKLILKLESKMPTELFFQLLKIFSKCKNCLDGYFFPYYGVKPHDHDSNMKCVFTNEKEIPFFILDKDCDECGTYYCSECKAGYQEDLKERIEKC